MDFLYIVAYVIGYICLGAIFKGYWDKRHPGNSVPLLLWPFCILVLFFLQTFMFMYKFLYNLGGRLYDFRNMAYYCLFGNRE